MNIVPSAPIHACINQKSEQKGCSDSLALIWYHLRRTDQATRISVFLLRDSGTAFSPIVGESARKIKVRELALGRGTGSSYCTAVSKC